MKSNKIVLVDPNSLIHKTHESELYDDISKNEFFEWMEKNGYSFYTLKDMFDNKRIGSAEQNKFNILLKKAKEEIKVDICDSILYLEESFVKLKKLINLLDEETKFILKKELATKYKIKIEVNNLCEILR